MLTVKDKNQFLPGRDSPAVKNICSCRALDFKTQHIHGDSLPLISTALGDPIPYSDFCWH